MADLVLLAARFWAQQSVQLAGDDPRALATAIIRERASGALSGVVAQPEFFALE